jgi:integrase
MMIREKYITERYSKRLKDPDGQPKLLAYVVDIHYKEYGVRKHYNRNFLIEKYLNKTACLKAAIRDRDKAIPLVLRLSKLQIGEKDTYTVNELFELVPKYFPRTQGTYKKNNKVYKTYIKEKFGEKDIHSIEIIDVQESLEICAERCTQQQVRNVKTDWHRIFQVAIMKDLPVKDITQLIDTPISNKVTEKSVSEQNITQQDFERFCEFMSHYGGYLPWDDKQNYNRDILLWMLKFMRITGLRPQEAKAIHRGDIQFCTIPVVDKTDGHQTGEEEIAIVTIVRSIGSTFTQKLAEKKTKTAQSKRSLPVFDDGVKLIKDILEFSIYDRVFDSYQGQPFTADYVSDYYSRVSRACGIKVYAGLMRKAFSADNYSNGTNPAAIKKMMGHKNENMSVNWYATAADAEVLEAMRNRKYKTK